MAKVLKFYAEWCGPCKSLASILDGANVGTDIEGVDIDKDPEVAAEYAIRSVPTMVYVDENGTEISRITGSQSLDSIKKWLSSSI
jgi:thioredoxin 1